MSINKHLFETIYKNCVSIIDNATDRDILHKKVKLDAAFATLCRLEDPELQEFYSIVHELRLYQYIKDLGFKITAMNDSKAGPDFRTDMGYVECVCATKGRSGTPEHQWLNERLNQSMNRYESALSRLTSVIFDKKDKYKLYLQKQIIDDDTPCIIAVNTSIFSNEFHSQLNLDLVLKILYGIGCRTMSFNLETHNCVGQSEVETHLYENKALKPPRNADLSLDNFSRSDFKHISGIILNNNSIGEELEKEYFCLLLNPFARVAIDKSILQDIKYFALSETDGNSFTYKWFH